jgi:hypothetical protein
MAHPEEAELIVPADLGTLGMLSEYISQVPEDVRAEKCVAAIGYVLSFLGKRAKRPVLSVGPELKEAMVVRAYCQCLRYIGYPAGGAGDDQFQKAEDENKAWLDLVRKGEVEPEFTDSSPNVAEFGPLGGTSQTADAWAYRDSGGAFCRRSRCC